MTKRELMSTVSALEVEYSAILTAAPAAADPVAIARNGSIIGARSTPVSAQLAP